MGRGGTFGPQAGLTLASLGRPLHDGVRPVYARFTDVRNA